MTGDAPSSGCMASSTDLAASKVKQLFVSFWRVGLENIPEGTFVLDDQDDVTHMVRPLVFADIGGGSRLLIVSCHYTLASELKEGALEFEVAADSVTFHLFEALTGDTEVA